MERDGEGDRDGWREGDQAGGRAGGRAGGGSWLIQSEGTKGEIERKRVGKEDGDKENGGGCEVYKGREG